MIENIELLAYVRDTISFCRTLVIKYEDLAKLDNALIKSFYKVDPGTDKSKWRYYMNLNGEYHFSDTPMEVKSLDDNTIIAFTKENLELHPATKSAYRLGSYYYTRLVDLYSHQRDLINGIINPIPKEEAIAARDFKILRYTSEYVLWNEIQLIPALQKWIDDLAYQTFSTEYKYTDNLMYGALLVHLLETSVKFVLTARHEARFTRYAHSFYIWSKLQSEGISPSYQSLLNEKQTMWLFRNVEYVMRNLGQEKTFNELMDILLTEREIPLSKYDMAYDTENMPEELVPEAKYITARLNMTDRLGLGVSLRQINMTMLKEIPDAIDNDVNYDKMVISTVDDTQFGIASNYPLKILESEMTDTTNRQPETFYHVLNSELIYLAGNDLYDIQIDFTEQLTGNHYTMSVSEAIVVWHYLFFKTMGMQQTNIPEFRYNKALKVIPPTVKELMSLSGGRLLEEDWCTALYKTHIPQFRVISPTKFYENARAIFDLKWAHKKMVARHPAIGYFSRRDNAASTMYETGVVKLTDYKTFDELLERFGLGFETYTKEDCYVMMWEIWQKMTGWNLHDHQTIAQIQSGMIGLMRFMSSYSLQYIKQTDIQSGFFQGGLDMMTDNPMNLRDTGPMPELESEGTRISIPHRVVTHNSLDMSFVGIIEEAGMVVSADMEMRGKIFETPRIWWNEDPDSIWDMKGGHLQVLREATELPWDIEDLIPKGALSPQYTRGLIVDTLIGEMQAGPYRAIGIEIVNNNLDNEIVTYDVSGFPVDQYSEFREEVDSSTSGRNSPKSIGASYVNTKAHYDLGFVPKHVGDGVVKFDLLAQHEDTGEIVRVRFQYDVTIDEGPWVNTYEIPESVILNGEFPITPTMTGLDINGDDLKGATYVLASGLEEWLTIRQDGTGALFGTFTKAGWPDQLYMMTKATIKPSGQGDDNHVGDKFRYMVGLIPSDRYYDPAKDPDFIPNGGFYNESDYYSLVKEKFTTVTSKKGWTVTGMKFADTTRNKANLRGTYGGKTNWLSPISDGFVDSEDGKRTFTIWYGTAKKGSSSYDMISTITNEEGLTIDIPWVYTSTERDHEMDMAVTRTTTEIPVGYTQHPLITMSKLPTDGSQFKSNHFKTETVGGGGKLTTSFTETYVGLRVGTMDITVSGLLTAAANILMLSGVNGKNAAKTQPMQFLKFATLPIGIEDAFDVNDFTIDELGFVPWEVQDWRVNELKFDRLLVKENVKGWYVESMEHARDDNGNYLTANIRTKLTRSEAVYDIPLPPPDILMRRDNDGGVALPEGYQRVYGVGAVPILEGGLGVKLKVVLSNTYIGKSVRTEVITHGVSVLPDVFSMTLDPTQILRSGEKDIAYATAGYPLPDEKPDWYFNQDTGYFPGLKAYSNGVTNVDAEHKVITFPDFNVNLKDPGIGVCIEARYTHKTRTLSNSVAWYQMYYTFSSFEPDDILIVYPPKLEDFDFKAENEGVHWFKDVTSTALVTYNSDAVHAIGNWSVDASKTRLTAWGADNQDDVLKTRYDEFDFSNEMYGMSVQTLPAGSPSGRGGIYPKFTPVQLGKQKYTLEVVVTSNLTSRSYSFLFDFELDIGTIDVPVYIENEANLWYPINETVTAKMVFDIPDTPIGNKTLPYAKEYPSVASEIAASVSSSGTSTIKVKILSHPDPDHIANIVGYQRAFYDGFVSTDPRRIKTFYGNAGVDTSRFYETDEIDVGSFDFQPDIVFADKLRYQVYTERWIYNLLPRGWYINTIGYDGDRPKEVMYEYEQDGATYQIPVLNRFLHTKAYDNSIPAPDGKNFMFPIYGLNVAGEVTLKLKINIIGTYHTGRKDIFLDLDAKAIESGIDFTQNFKDGLLRIGEINDYTLTTNAIPPADKLEWAIGGATIFQGVGKSANLLTTNPVDRKVTVPVNYPGDAAKLVYGIQYDSVSDALVPPGSERSDTWFRTVVTDDVFESEKFVPSITLFDPVVAKEATLLAEAVNNVRFYVNSDVGDWTVTRLGMKGGGGTTQPDVTLEYGGTPMAWMYSESKWPSVVPVNGVNRNAFLVGFVPSTTGDKTYKMEFEITNSHGVTRIVEFDYNVTVYGVADVLISPPTSTIMYINQAVTKNIRPFGWTIPAGSTQKYSGSYPYGQTKGKVKVEQTSTVLQPAPNTRFTFLEVSDHDFEFLGTATLKLGYTAATDLIDDGNGSLIYYGDYLFDKALVQDPDDISGFIPTPDLVYGTYQPYEDVTDRYTIPITYNGWTLKSADYQDVVGKEMAFTGFTGKEGITRPRGWVAAKADDTALKYLYLELCPLTSGSQSYPVDIVVENGSGVQKTLTFMDVRAVQPRTSFMTIPEKTFKSGYATTFPFTFIDHPAERLGAGLDVGDCIVESLDGLKDGESLSYRLHEKDMTVTLAYGRTEDARYYVRWSYHWAAGSRSSDNNIRNISYYSEIDIAEEDVTNGNIFDPTEFTITPDLLYAESQPYEQQTDRFITSMSVGPWDFYGGDFDQSVINDGSAFTKFDDGPVISSPSVMFKNNNNTAKTTNIYLSVTPTAPGEITYPVNFKFKNRYTEEIGVLQYQYVKHVKERRSWIRLPINEFQAGADNLTQLYHDNTPGSKVTVGPGNGMGGWYAAGGFNSAAKSGEVFTFDWSNLVNIHLNANRGEDAVFWLRKTYYWQEIDQITGEIDPRGADDYMSNLVFFNRLVVPAANVTPTFIANLATYFQFPKTDANGKVDQHYINEAIHYTKAAAAPKDIPQRADFQFPNKWRAVAISESDIETKYPYMDREFIAPWIFFGEDDGLFDARFSPKAKNGSSAYTETIKYTLQISDDYKNNRYLPLEYPYEVSDRGTKFTTDVTTLATGVRTALNLQFVNVPAYRGGSAYNSVLNITAPGFETILTPEWDTDTAAGFATSLQDFDETRGAYLLIKDEVTPTGGNDHWYFSRLPISKSEKKELPPDPHNPPDPVIPGIIEGVNFNITNLPETPEKFKYNMMFNPAVTSLIPRTSQDPAGNTWTVQSVDQIILNEDKLNYFINKGTTGSPTSRVDVISDPPKLYFGYIVKGTSDKDQPAVAWIVLNIKDQNGNLGKTIIRHVADGEYGPTAGSVEMWMDVNVVTYVQTSLSSERYTRIDTANPAPEGNNNGIVYFVLDKRTASNGGKMSNNYKVRFLDSSRRYYFSQLAWQGTNTSYVTEVILLKALPGEQFAKTFYGEIHMYKSEADIPDDRRSKILYKNF